MKTRKTEKTVVCTRVVGTTSRPHAKGTYIVRLSGANQDKLGIKNKAYVNIAYGAFTVLARLVVDETWDDDDSICMDQTVRTAIGLEAILQGQGHARLEYTEDGTATLEHPILIRPARFKGPGLLARLVKQQHLVCLSHIAMSEDMEKPIVRLSRDSMDVLGIKAGDKVLLITEKTQRSYRCLVLEPQKGVQLPTKIMMSLAPKTHCPLPDDPNLRLPWITADLQIRKEIGVEPWQAVLVGRDPAHALTAELNTGVTAIAISALGAAVALPSHPTWQIAIFAAAVIGISVFICLKIRSRI